MEIKDIKSPEFLKSLSKEQLECLCDDIREFLIDSLSKTGGHLSSNLGVVELTVALHKVFDSPSDKFIFDVGHQCYVHKILTGRADKFNTLRQTNGISGFQSISESDCDPYEGGHSSTSISAALGFAKARDIKGENHNVIAIIGDGSIANGLAYEALNLIDDYNGKLIIIINDNGMSISQNVGAMHNLLDHIRGTENYSKTKSVVKRMLGSIPFIGDRLVNTVEKTKIFFKNIYNKEGRFFNQLGIDYYGPINGHDISELTMYLNIAKTRTKPVIIHVITKKGKGYRFAEDDNIGNWHGVGPFDKETGKPLSVKNGVSFSKAIADSVTILAEKDPMIVAITPAMTVGSSLLGFKNKFPDRFFDVGIAEEHALVYANSLSLCGIKPFVAIYSTFMQRGYDEIVHDIARMNGNVVIGIDRAGIIDENGVSHQGVFDIPMLLPIPNVIIAQPKDADEADSMLALAFSSKNPFFIRYSKARVSESSKLYKPINIGSWEMLTEGSDCTIITYGDFVADTGYIKENLERKGISASIVNARFIKPMDFEMLDYILSKDKYVFIWEESMQVGSLGSAVAEYMVNKDYTCPLHLFGIKECFVKHGSRDDLLKELKLDKESIVSKIEDLLKPNKE